VTPRANTGLSDASAEASALVMRSGLLYLWRPSRKTTMAYEAPALLDAAFEKLAEAVKLWTRGAVGG